MNTNIKHALVALAAGCVMVPTLARAAEDSDQTAENARRYSSNELEEIVITAQRREERLQDVPISVSVLMGKELDSSADRGVADALNSVPGVVSAYTNVNARLGSASGGVVVVRGVAPAAGGSTTGYYLDTIPFGYVADVFNTANAPDPNAYDLERVEVLRGPQGTLYGVNALNGVVRVLTKDANLNNFELKGRVSTSSTEHGGENYRGDIAVNVPLIEGKLAARAVVGYEDWDGWIDKPLQKDANDARIANYRLKINAQPTDKLSVGMSGWFSRSNIGAPNTSADGLHSDSLLDESSSVDSQAYGFKVGYDLSAFTVTSMTSYLDFQFHTGLDFTPFIPVPAMVLATHNDTRMYSEEIVLNSIHAGPWRWTLGGMYRNATDHAYQFLEILPSFADNSVESKSTAVFGELTRALLDGRLELTGGLRYFEDKKRNWETSRANLINGVTDPVTGLFALFPEFHDRYSKTTPRVVLTWHPSMQATIYASYAEGFRSGLNQLAPVRAVAPQQFPSAQPDDLKSYELGAKGSAWDGRFSFDSAVYYLDWQGVQQSLFYTISTDPLFVSAAVTNAQSVSGVGAEFGASVQTVHGLSLSASVSWNDLKMDENVFQGNTILYAKGQRINASPEYTASVSAEYAFPLGRSGYKGRLAVSGNYLSKMINDRASATVLYYAEPVTMTRASFAVQSEGRWTASLYGDNLTNEKGVIEDQFSPRWRTYLRPRTIGLQFEFHY